MSSRVVGLTFGAVLAGIAVAYLLVISPAQQAASASAAMVQPGTRRVVPPGPPPFSPEYGAALRDIVQLEAADARALEERLAQNPNYWPDRLKLLAYYARADHATKPEMRARRAEHYLWLVEHQPEVEVLRSPYGQAEPGLFSAEQETQAIRLWRHAINSRPTADVLRNAAEFFTQRDAAEGMRLLKVAVRKAPDNWHYGMSLGYVYAGHVAEAMRTGQQQTASALIEEVREMKSAAVMEPIVWVLQRAYISSVMLDQEKPVYRDMAASLFSELVEMNPNVDRDWVLPEVKPELRGLLTRVPRPVDHEALLKRTRRLAPSDFKRLPRGIVEVLERRDCLIPQAGPEGPVQNVIRGNFFGTGDHAWAALCSSGGRSSILVFRSGSDTKPEVVADGLDSSFVGGAENGAAFYLRQIRPVGRDFIISHYRAYGGPEPPPIRHQGIDDAFLEKASIVWYRHKGKWVQLQGAD